MFSKKPMFSGKQKPIVNLNFEEDSAKALSIFIKHIGTHFKDEPNIHIAVAVLECLLYIKLNIPFIKYAIENKENDNSIYKYTLDKKKQVLRAPNDVSFHIISYKNEEAEKAIAEYDKIISLIEAKIDFLMKDSIFARIFIRKINDSNDGCMEHRLQQALDFLANPLANDLNSIFHDCYNQQVRLGIRSTDTAEFISHVINYFDSFIDTYVWRGTKYLKLTWGDIKEYLIQNVGYEDNELKPTTLLQDAIVTREDLSSRNRIFYGLSFATKELAKAHLDLIRLSLPNDLYQQSKKCMI